MRTTRARQLNSTNRTNPHDGFAFDFINRKFTRKGRGSSALSYSEANTLDTFGGDSTDNRFVGSNGLIQNISNTLFRLDYAPSTLQVRGALFEPQITNLCLQSQTFDNASWVKTNTTVGSNVTTDPAGTSLADSIIEDLVGPLAFTLSQTINFTTDKMVTYSVWAKANTRNWIYLELPSSAFTAAARVYFDLTNGVVGTSSGSPAAFGIEAYSSGWYRIWVRKLTTATAAGDILIGLADADNSSSYLGDGTSELFVWGAQVEEPVSLGIVSSSSPTSYDDTTTSTSVRSDVDWDTLLRSEEFGASVGTILVEFMVDALPLSPIAFFAVANGIALQLFANGTINISDEALGTDGATSNTVIPGIFHKAGGSWGNGMGANTTNTGLFATLSGDGWVNGAFDKGMGAVATNSVQFLGEGTGSPSSKIWVRQMHLFTYQLSAAEILAWCSKPCIT